MPRIHFGLGEDEGTLLATLARGLEAEVEVDAGSSVDFAKNRAIDQLWQHLPFCHAAAALMALRVFDAATSEELPGTAEAVDGARLVLGHEPPGSAPPPSAEAEGWALVAAGGGRKKLGVGAGACTSGAAGAAVEPSERADGIGGRSRAASAAGVHASPAAPPMGHLARPAAGAGP